MGKRILIVEDEENIALALKELLCSKGHEVSLAFRGSEAMEYLAKISFDLVLLDINIPEMNGIEILKEVKEKSPGVKTVVLTGFLEEYKNEIERIGCDAFLNKPFSIKTLISVLDSVLLEKRESKERFSSLINNPEILAKAKILFIEPNEIMYSSKLAYFQDVGRSKGQYQLEAAFNENQVLEALKEFKPDIILSSVGMFRLYKLAERFKNLPKPPKDVILYGLSSRGDVDKNKDISFIGGFFDPVVAAVAPTEMDKLGKIVRATSITHNLYIKLGEGAKNKKLKFTKPLISHSIVFLLLFSLAFFGIITIVFYAKERFSEIFGCPILIKFISILIIVFSARPIEVILINLTDRFLFQKARSSRQILIQASKGMVLITDIKKLFNLIARIVKKYLKVRSVYIFQYDEAEQTFLLICRRGEDRNLAGDRIENNHPLINWLKEKKDIVLYGSLGKSTGIRGEFEKLDCAVCVPSFWKGELSGFLILSERLSGEDYSKEEVSLLSTLSNEVAIAVENAKNFLELRRFRERERESYLQTVLALAKTVDEKDHYTRGHLEDVARYGMEVAKELSNTAQLKIDMDDLKTTLLLHDIGKIGVPDALLHKEGKLTPEEWVVMKQHCEIGERIIKPIEKLKNVGKIIRCHQEKYDGTGYPDGLKGNEIPLEARIIAVVDAYHAMISDRPYRKAMSEEAAIKELKDNAGTQFDPVVVDTFIRAWEKGRIKGKEGR